MAVCTEGRSTGRICCAVSALLALHPRVVLVYTTLLTALPACGSGQQTHARMLGYSTYKATKVPTPAVVSIDAGVDLVRR